MNYELFYLIGNSKEIDLAKIKAEVMEIVTANGGVFEAKETQEKRKLSYQIKHETHGTYIAQRFDLPETEKVEDIITKLNLHQGVLRFILSKTEDLPELKTKEERMGQVQAVETKKEAAPVVEIKKTEVAAEEKPAEEKTEEAQEEAEEVAEEKTKKEEKAKKEKKKTSDEDIDKKLEEILNI